MPHQRADLLSHFGIRWGMG